MLTVTFIRHGESEDNIKEIWAGWKDSPLSKLGQRQATAVGEYFATTKFDAVYASPLLRAHATGLAVHQRQTHKPPFVVNPNLREQNFGIAEGHRWVYSVPDDMSDEEAFKEGLYSADVVKFPGGESFADLLERAHVAVREVVFPHFEQAAKGDVHIAIASHGHCIAMLIKALISVDPAQANGGADYFGLMNTAWTRVVVDVPASYVPTENPELSARVVLTNQHSHLDNVKPSAPEEEGNVSKEARAFFGGAKV